MKTVTVTIDLIGVADDLADVASEVNLALINARVAGDVVMTDIKEAVYDDSDLTE